MTRSPICRNRAALGDHIARAFDRAVDGNETFAVLCIDLDRFEEINDVYGHSAGDRFLAEVGRRLALACDGAFLARLGGDEFTIVSSGGVQPAATPSAMTGSASVRPRPRMACMIAAAGECLPILAFLM